MNLEDCLPSALRGPHTTITRLAAGMSGAGVHRVESAGQSFVLKVAAEAESDADWRHALHVQRLAASAGLAPRIVHVDEARRAVLTDFVTDRSFPLFYRNPSTHEAALTLLGRTVRRIHALPIPADPAVRNPRELLAQVWSGIQEGFPLPDFARHAAQRVLAEAPPTGEGVRVLGHNDLNPSNLIYDGESILLLDWATAGLTDSFFDLATLAVLLRMDEGMSLRLLSAYDGTPCTELPPRFRYNRRLVAALVGTMLLYLARNMKHAGATGAETLDSTPTLGDFYQRLSTGAVRLGTADGQWTFGLTLLKESLAL
jgi:aminoglycoside phosphotransferase (APT) family kinase protein